MKQYAHLLNGASLAGLASFTVFLLFYYLFGANPLGPIKFLVIAVPTVFYVFSLKKYRDETLNGIMPFNLTMTPSVLFAFVYASMVSALLYFTMTLLDPGILESHILNSLKQMGQTKEMMIDLIGKDRYEDTIEEMKNMSAGTLAFSDFFSKFCTAAVFNLVIAAILRKNQINHTLDE
jgi:hypothetical protein